MSKTVLSTQQESPGSTPPRRCQLVVIDGPDVGRAVALGEAPVRVGTREGCALRLSDPRVSGEHLEVHAEGAGFVVRDLGSRNGTLYEGSRVGEARVRVGATLKVGRSFLRIQAEGQAWEVAPSQARRFGQLVGESLAMRELFAVLEHVAPTDTTVLLQGETGTGKEVVARALHEASARRKGPFVAVDCGALPEGLVESELFGHVRGAFTGALAARSGAFVRAKGGTLFLDELAGISPPVQARLLRVLEERWVRPVGGDAEQGVDVRAVAASRVDLSLAVAEGTFRPDLYYRLAVVTLSLPPLRQRREDLPLLVAELLRRRGFEPGPIRGPGLETLSGHDWPGNVRELRNVLERALVLSRGAQGFEELRLSLQPQGEGPEVPLRTDLHIPATRAVCHIAGRRCIHNVDGEHTKQAVYSASTKRATCHEQTFPPRRASTPDKSGGWTLRQRPLPPQSRTFVRHFKTRLPNEKGPDILHAHDDDSEARGSKEREPQQRPGPVDAGFPWEMD